MSTPTRGGRGPVVLLLLVLVVVSLLLALTLSSVVQQLLPDDWPFGVRFWLPAAVLALAFLVGQVWAWRVVRRPPGDPS